MSMSAAGSIPALRLVRTPQSGGWRTPTGRAGDPDVRAENHAAAALAATDARWVLAVRTAAQLQGGRAAFLAPERRRRLGALASRMGLRPFDAALVIAIIQDAARAGLEPLGSQTESRLLLIPAAHRAPTPSPGLLLTLSAALATAFFAAAVLWLTAP